jgi:hypothetical protein
VQRSFEERPHQKRVEAEPVDPGCRVEIELGERALPLRRRPVFGANGRAACSIGRAIHQHECRPRQTPLEDVILDDDDGGDARGFAE